MVRGPWIISGYYRDEKPLLHDGWFDSGDIAVLDDDNTVRLTDRAKDVIKSGGEWISSIDVENLAMGCPGVAEAAVVGIPHPKWEERPLLVVVPLAGASRDRAIDRGASGRQDRQMVDARRCRVRRSAQLRGNRQNPEDGVAPPLRRPLFGRGEVDRVKRQAACLPVFALAGAGRLGGPGRAPGPGRVWTSLA